MKKELTEKELSTLTKVLDKLEYETLLDTGYIKINGGFATTELIDYDDEFIDIVLKFGSQDDVSSHVTTEQYKIDRKSFEIID